MSEQMSVLELAAELRTCHRTLIDSVQFLRKIPGHNDNATMLAHDLAQDASRAAMLAMTSAITAMRNANYFIREEITRASKSGDGGAG